MATQIHIYGDNFFQNIGFTGDDFLQMYYFEDNLNFLRLYIIVIIKKISIERALFSKKVFHIIELEV